MNKRGWLKVIESFIAILLVITIVLVVISNKNIRRDDASLAFYNTEKSILKEIQLNSTLRSEIVNTPEGTEVGEIDFPEQTRLKIEARTPSQINCTAKICSPSDICLLTDDKITELGIKEKDVYAESVMITSTVDTFSPRVLKLFCWGR